MRREARVDRLQDFHQVVGRRGRAEPKAAGLCEIDVLRAIRLQPDTEQAAVGLKRCRPDQGRAGREQPRLGERRHDRALDGLRRRQAGPPQPCGKRAARSVGLVARGVRRDPRFDLRLAGDAGVGQRRAPAVAIGRALIAAIVPIAATAAPLLDEAPVGRNRRARRRRATEVEQLGEGDRIEGSQRAHVLVLPKV